MSQAATEQQSAPRPALAPDGVVGFGIAEMGLLVSSYAGPGKQQALDLLRLSDDFVDQPVTIAGASSLVARGYATVQPTETEDSGDTVTLAGPAAMLGYCLTNAARWTSLALMHGDDSDAAFFVQSPTVSVMLQPRAMGTWFVVFPSEHVSPAEFLTQIVRENTDLDPTRAVYLGTRVQDGTDNLFVRKLSETTWTIAFVRDESSPAEESDTDDAGLLDALRRITTLPGA